MRLNKCLALFLGGGSAKVSRFRGRMRVTDEEGSSLSVGWLPAEPKRIHKRMVMFWLAMMVVFTSVGHRRGVQ